MIEADRASDGLFSFNDLLPTVLSLAGAPERLPADRYIDGVDQIVVPARARTGDSHRKFHYYWLIDTFSALRVRRVQVDAVLDQRRRHATCTARRVHRGDAALTYPRLSTCTSTRRSSTTT